MLYVDQKPASLSDELALALRRLERERRARQQAEAVLEAKSLDLYQKHQELLRLNARLEDRVKQRTEELADAVARAERANAAKGEFLARMSHEIRTPMNGVIGMLEALKSTRLQSTQMDYLATAYRSAESLLDLINDILDFSKIEAGQMSIESIDFDLPALLDHVTQLWEPKARSKSLRLRAVVDQGAPRWVRGDPTRLLQVLSNLISNALKFTQQGGVVLKVNHLESTDGASVRLRFAVEDTGIGMNDEVRGRLFGAFMQADGSTSRRYGGTGLGLAICKQLIGLMGGAIDVTSSEGQGTTFHFELRFMRSQRQEADYPAAPSLAAHATAGKLSGKVLVVDDNETNRKVVLAMLTQLGVQADSAENGQEAIQAVRQARYDAVLMDCHMPIVDGYEATLAIRVLESDEARTRTPIIALTASAFQEDRDRCAAAGMDDFLAKPIKTAAMKAALCKWLPIRTGDAAQPEAANESPAPVVEAHSAVTQPRDDDFDREHYNEMREISGAGFGALVAQFHRNVGDGFDAIRTAMQGRDALALQQAAHKLKGSAATLGVKHMSDECAYLESTARRGAFTGVEESFARLQRCYQDVSRWSEFRA